MLAEIPHGGLTYRINGAAMRVHSRLGPGLKEEHYDRALAVELRAEGLAVEEQYYLEIYDGEVWLGRLYVDLWVEQKVIVEINALDHLLTNDEIAQVITCLAASDTPVGLLLNFGRRRLEYRRILPPKKLDGWKECIRRFLWRPTVTPASGA